jgi:Rrf2 family protein
MLSQTTEYALRAVVFLAGQHGSPRTTSQIAAATKVPVGYLAKVMQGLCRAGLVRSQRGLHGGFTLRRDPPEMSLLEVIEAVEPIRRFPTCPLGLPNHGRNLCPLHRRLDDAAAAIERAFRDTTLQDLLQGPRSRRPLCRETSA